MTRTGRIAAGLAGVLAGGLVGTGCLGMGGEESTERIREDGPVARVDIELDGGTIDIGGSAGTGATGTITSRWHDTAPEIVHYVEDGVLHVLGRCDPYAGPCLLDVQLTLPATAAVSVSTGEGDVSVRGVAGDVEIKTEEGAFEGHDLAGSLFVESQGGDILADGLAGLYVDARTQRGGVDLRMDTRPARLVGRTENGDVTLVVPRGSYRVEADAPQGDTDIAAGILDDPAADAVIVGETGNGDVIIRAREAQ